MHAPHILFSLLLGIPALGACSGTGPSAPSRSAEVTPGPATTEYVECTTPRPEMCAQVHQPVCGKRDTGIRCVTTPCPSEEKQTYSNGCIACSDPKVYGYTDGACAK